ncbi:MAG: GTP cyclohydrolase II [Wolbachia endosymbiont of Fragariocoptes setiger]|nr:GTP cyclohydrolase II [Wolbachia endosymbiont of Fragariocoptes setiger]
MFTHNRDKNRVERIICDIRRGVPVMVYNENSYLLFSAAEISDQNLFNQYQLVAGKIYITLTARRAEYISQCKEHNNKRLLINNFDEVLSFISPTPQEYVLYNAKAIDEHVISLLKLAELLPYGLVTDMSFSNVQDMQRWCKENDILELDCSLIEKFQQVYDVYEVCKAPLFLEENKKVSIVSYRTYNGQKEHYAIIIGDLSADELLVRIHSSCYTGDLLDSLSCDCRSQLNQSIKLISDFGNGIILYLMQDGRGIGLINKLRAYAAQREHNLDTVDGNRILGFDDDERKFIIAAKMLEKMNIKKIQLLTNNNKKLLDLESYGITVVKTVPLIVEHNRYNYDYMKTKYDKLGHKLMIF